MQTLKTPNPLPVPNSVFVATGYKQRADGVALLAQLEKRGIASASDWATVAPGSLSKREMAVRDAVALRRADVLVVLMTLPDYQVRGAVSCLPPSPPPSQYNGTFWEMGFALGLGKPIVLITPFAPTDAATCVANVYYHMPEYERYASVTEFLAELDRK